MATLQTIRKRAGVLIAVIIGIALLAFVLGDFISNSGSSPFGGSDRTIAEIDGQELPYDAFQNKIDEFVNNYKLNAGQDADLSESVMDGIREQAWEDLIKEAIMYTSYDDLGLSVHQDELYDMVAGKNVDAQVQQIFVNPETKMYDPMMVNQFLEALQSNQATEEQRAWWVMFEQILLKNRLTIKYNNLVKKGLFITSAQAKLEAAEAAHKVNFNYVSQPYDLISDSAIEVTQADIDQYYNEHQSDYEQEASRDISYTAFNILPSERDFNIADEWIKQIRPEFEATDNDIQFVNLNADTPFEDKYYKAGELPLNLDSLLFAADTGFIHGPIFENNTYYLYKLSRIEYISDSVRARHILIQPSETMPLEQAKAFADSLKIMIENGTGNFEQLALAYSADKSNSEKGGDLEWFKDARIGSLSQNEQVMVKPFNDSCFTSSVGEVKLVETQFGFHIIQVTDKSEEVKKVQLATIDRLVEPSTETYQNLYAIANAFAANNTDIESFDASIEADPGLQKNLATSLKESDKNIPGLESPRDLVRWAYEAEKGDISSVFEFGNRFVVAALTEIYEEGIAPVEQVRSDIELVLFKEKKGEKLADKLTKLKTQYSSLEKIAIAINDTIVREAVDINFTSFNIPGIGVEPKLIANAVNIQQGIISEPVTGNNGVYLIKVTASNEVTDIDYLAEQRKLLSNIRSRVDYQAYEAIKKSANVADFRSKYF